MEALVAKYENASGRILKFSANTKKSMGRLETVAAINARVALLDSYWANFQELDSEVNEKAFLKPKCFEEFDLAAFDDVEMEYITAMGELTGLIKARNPDQNQNQNMGQNNGQVVENGGQREQPRMKAIEAPAFTGEIEDWVSFRDLFQSIVTNNRSLSDVQKLQHLKMSCKGKASDIIKHIQVTEANFTVAWQELIKRYENKRLLVSRMLEKVLELPSMTRECPIQLAKLIDGTSQCIRSLAALERATEHWDDWLVVQTTRRLDYSTRLAWEKSIGTTVEMPTYTQLEEYLNGVLRSFEAVKQCGTMPTFEKRRSVKVHTIEAKNGCFLCNGGHLLAKCSQFLAKSIKERRQFISSNGVCFNCLCSTRHTGRMCPSQYRCLECRRLHHTLLHTNDNNERDEQSTSNNSSNSGSDQRRRNPFDRQQQNTNAVSSLVCNQERTWSNVVLLPTAWVTITGNNGHSVQVRALVDQGSQASFVTEDVVQRLMIARTSSHISVVGIGETSPGRSCGMVDLQVTSTQQLNVSVKVAALVLPKITAKIPNQPITRTRWAHTVDLPLADKYFGRPGRIDLLLGADVFGEILRRGVRHGRSDEPIAQETIFGWILSGQSAGTTMMQQVNTMHITLEDILQKFWQQEEPDQHKKVHSADDEECEQIYNRTTIRHSDGKYIVQLPFRQGIRELGDSKMNAIRRLLQVEKRANKDPKMYESYKEFMNTYLDLNHMERIPIDERDVQPHYYLPHHAVLKPDSSSTKLRVVFDATLPTSNGKGLNEMLLTGPRLQENLTSILMRWRMHRIAFSADIEKMYRQIWVSPMHCDYQRIVWRNNPQSPIDHYRLKTVTYGTASAPYMAIKTLQRLAQDEASNYPRASMVMMNDFYVDDCLSGADTVDEAYEIKNELVNIMHAGGLRLLKWSSNNEQLLRSLPEDHLECTLPLNIEHDDTIKALGIRWHPVTDEFGYKVTISKQQEAKTKRRILSEIAKLYDPLGLLALTVITAKILMQQLWLTGLGWDDILPEEIQAKWRAYQEQLPQIEGVRIRRWYGFTKNHKSVELHGFSDASIAAYSACVYVRVEKENGDVQVTLMAAKTKVAPVKQQTIPRLELNGAVLLSQLLVECQQALKCKQVVVHAWTDSTVVLAWLQQHSNVWPTYIANRISKIHSTMTAQQWRHVPGQENPADVASRGVMPSVVKQHSLWWEGPWWLKAGPEKWPQLGSLNVDLSLLERKNVVSHVIKSNSMFELAERFSEWIKLLRVTAYCLRVLRRNWRHTGELKAEELGEARLVWLQQAQENGFGDVRSLVADKKMQRNRSLMRLNPFVDDRGVMRVGGRLHNAYMTYDERHPCILPAHNVITWLIIRDAHKSTLHGGLQHTIGQLHQRYWVLKERTQVKKLIHNCLVCFKMQPSKTHQIMGNLPAARINISRPFLHTGIDYAGPIWSRTSRGRGQKAIKSWIAIFICFSTKAVHLELVSDLSTAAFIAAFKRFVARRGRCSDVYCDNGTNFVGADRELRSCIRSCTNDPIWAAYTAELGTKFHFAPPGSPHFNGLAEAAVKMAKSSLHKIIGDSKLTFEEMCTFLSQIESVLNSRPLCAASQDDTDENVLTPGHFLIGQPLTSVPEPNLLDATGPLANRWQATQRMVQHFWKRWSREYLHHMQQIHKWQKPFQNVKIGDIVLIRDEALPPNKWKIGRIVDTHPGSDGMVRVVSIRTTNKNVIRRSIVKISVVPMDQIHTGNNNN